MKITRDQLIEALDLSRPELAETTVPLRSGQSLGWDLLLEHFRSRRNVWCPVEKVLKAVVPATPDEIQRAEDTLNHRFLASPGMQQLHSAQYYGEDIDWSANPVQNINWVGHMQRFFWDQWLASAYLSTRDERYAAGWVRLVEDWISKDEQDWTSFAYAPLQIGCRSMRWAADFELYKSSDAFTGGTLPTFLTAVHNHAQKSALQQTHTHHNATIVEAVGLLYLAVVFPVFKESETWFMAAVDLLAETVSRQVTQDGVQKEWGVNYHIGIVHWLINTVEFLRNNDREDPTDLWGTAEQMSDFLFAALSPDRQYPMFSDARRPGHDIAGTLRRANEVFDKPHYVATLDENAAGYPEKLDYCFPDGGMYFLRSGWGRDAIYMAVHCSPTASSSHDQPDNGTFELHAFGRWLMPDSGCYAYGHGQPEAEERNWFRQTCVHQTLTRNNQNSVNAPKHLFFHSSNDLTVIAFENQSYPDLVHRRVICFVDRCCFLMLDEAVGDEVGDIEVHFQLSPGDAVPDLERGSIRTNFADANVLICKSSDTPAELVEEPGQVSFLFHEKQPRPAIAFRQQDRSSAVFLTGVFPYEGTVVPDVHMSLNNHELGVKRFGIDVSVNQVIRRLSIDLRNGEGDG